MTRSWLYTSDNSLVIKKSGIEVQLQTHLWATSSRIGLFRSPPSKSSFLVVVVNFSRTEGENVRKGALSVNSCAATLPEVLARLHRVEKREDVCPRLLLLFPPFPLFSTNSVAACRSRLTATYSCNRSLRGCASPGGLYSFVFRSFRSCWSRLPYVLQKLLEQATVCETVVERSLFAWHQKRMMLLR